MNKPFHNYTFTCLVCEKQFLAKKPNAKTCSSACRSRLWRSRHSDIFQLLNDLEIDLTKKKSNFSNDNKFTYLETINTKLESKLNQKDPIKEFHKVALLPEIKITHKSSSSTYEPGQDIETSVPFEVLQNCYGQVIRVFGCDFGLSDVFNDETKLKKLKNHILRNKPGYPYWIKEQEYTTEIKSKQNILQIILNNREEIYKQLEYVDKGVWVYESTVNPLLNDIRPIVYVSRHKL